MTTSPIELRPATLLDCVAVWLWNNRPEVRAVSLTTDAIPLIDHRVWFDRRLSEPRTQLSIVEVDGRPAGVVRIQPDGDEAIVSIVLEPTVRGEGVGRRALTEACARYAAAHPDAPITAWIHADNHASARCFEAAGFAPVDAADRDGRSWRIYQWREDR